MIFVLPYHQWDVRNFWKRGAMFFQVVINCKATLLLSAGIYGGATNQECGGKKTDNVNCFISLTGAET